MKLLAARLMLVVLCIELAAGLGVCGEREELLTIAKDLQVAIEQQNQAILLEYAHGRTCFGEDCYEKEELLALLKDDNSWPNQMLFIGDYSIRKYVLGSSNLSIDAILVDEQNGFWQVTMRNSASSWPMPAIFYFVKSQTGWRLTHIDFG